jgi:transcriptional regulator with XRE-family HTH domain
MTNSKTLLKNLKTRLRADGISYRELSRRLGLSESTVKRDLSHGTFTLDRLDRMCEVLDVSLDELLVQAPDALTVLSDEQEQALVSRPKLLLTAYLVATDWKFDDILASFQYGDSELVDLLLKLDQLGIVEYRPPNRIRKRTAQNFSWRKDGPVHDFFLRRVAPEFFGGRFDGPADELRFVGGVLSVDSLLRFKDGIRRLAEEFETLARSDARLGLEARKDCSAILALRAWEFSEFTKLRRKK